MALLKGGSVVDGDLFVEDSIRAHNIQDLDGKNFPYVDTAQEVGYTNRIVRFSNNESGLVPTSASLTEDSTNKTILSFPEQSNQSNNINHELRIDTQSKNIEVIYSEIELDSDTSTWNFKK